MMATLAALAVLCGHLSLLAVGGLNTVLPDLRRQVVGVRGWMRPGDFTAMFALAQAAPGPNMMVTTLIGWRVAGLPGALVGTISFCGPSSLLTYGVSRVWDRLRGAPWRVRVQAGLVPVTVGLVLAAAAVLVRTTATGPRTAVLIAVCTAAFLRGRFNPLWLLGAAAAAGALGWLG